MTSEQFAYWLNGYSELNGGAIPNPAQWQMIREHLATVFLKVTPPLEVVMPAPDKPAFPYTPMPNVVIPHIYTASPTPPRLWDNTTVTC